MSRMDLIKIDIPGPAKPAYLRAADITMDAIREAGVCPRKALGNPMAVAVVLAWTRGEMSRPQVVHALRNLLILNPAMASTDSRPTE